MKIATTNNLGFGPLTRDVPPEYVNLVQELMRAEREALTARCSVPHILDGYQAFADADKAAKAKSEEFHAIARAVERDLGWSKAEATSHWTIV